MRLHCISFCSALFAAATLLAVAGNAAAGGLIPGAGEIVREGTLLDGLCSGKPYPQSRFEDSTRDWGPDKDGTPFTAVDVHTEFLPLDDQGRPKTDSHLVQWFEGNKDGQCTYDMTAGKKGIIADNRGIWIMRVHHVQIHKIFDSVGGWPASAGDGADAVTEIRFEVVGPNTCGNSAWVGLGPTDPACLRDNQKKQAADLANQEQQELPLRNADYQSMCGIGKLHGSMDYKSGKAGACIGYQLSIKSEDSEMQANQRIAHDPPNPDYMTVSAPHPPVQPDLARLPAAWTAYRAVLNDMVWVVADLQAMVTAIERANGAYAATARNPAADAWTQRQNQARSNAMDDAVDRVGDAQGKLSAAKDELIAAGIPQTTVDTLMDAEARQVDHADALVELLR